MLSRSGPGRLPVPRRGARAHFQETRVLTNFAWRCPIGWPRRWA